MKSIVITVLACATVITCVLLFRDRRGPEQPRYQLYSIDETSAASGKTVKSVYRLDTISGRAWRISSSPLQTGAVDAQHKPVVGWADAWEELAESAEAAVAKEQAGWQRALNAAHAAPTQETSATPP